MNNLFEMFSYGFMLKALIVGLCLSLSAALVGVPLVLRKNSMIGDGLSHVGFGAFAIAAALGLAPLWVALPVVVLASFFILRISENRKISGDSAVALISIGALALGTFVVSLSGSNVDINNYLFGSILSLGTTDVITSIVLSIIVIFTFVFYHRQIFAVTFDESFAKVIGLKTGCYNVLFALLCSLVIVFGMRLMGALLISALIVFPVLSAHRFAKNYLETVIFSVIISLISFTVGLVISYLLDTPAGATIALSGLAFFFAAMIFGKIIKKALQ